MPEMATEPAWHFSDQRRQAGSLIWMSMMESCQTGVYAIIHIASGKSYVGSAANSFKTRWRRHRTDLNTNRHHSILLQRAWNKYGSQAFEFKVLRVTEPHEAIEYEQSFIDLMKAADPKYGYNIYPLAASALGVKQSEEHIEKTRQASRKRWSKPEEREKARQAQLRRYADPVAREKNRQAQIKRFSKPEEIEKLRQAAIKYSSLPEVREKRRQAALKRFSDPAEVEKQRLSSAIRWSKPEEIEKARQGHRRQYLKPGAIEKNRQGQIKRFSDPANREKVRQATLKAHAESPHLMAEMQSRLREIYADPDKKAAFVAKRNATRIRNGSMQGSRHWNAKFTEADVLEIIKRVQNGESRRKIAKEKGVSHSTVKAIVSGKSWRHIRRDPCEA